MKRPLVAVALTGFLATVPSCRRAAEQPGTDDGRPEQGGADEQARQDPGAEQDPSILTTPAPDAFAWESAVARVEEVRGGGAPVTVPVELRHYNDRRRFLAVQLADSQGQNYDLPHDLAELAQMIEAGVLVELPALGENHILYEVGEDAREDPLAHYDVATGKDVPLVGSAAELEALRAAASAAERDALNRAYGEPATRDLLFLEHEAITDLARDFGGRSYDLQDAAQRAEFQRRLLSFVRPEAHDIVLEIARSYHGRFDRPLPVTSLIRTQRYQRRLSRVNPNATTKIEVPPHTTGMAFDISYKFMPPEEQDFVMDEVARMEREGRVEALRERRNHLHVYAFAEEPPAAVKVAQYLDDVGPDPTVRPAKSKKTRTASRTTRSKTRRAR